MTRDEILVMKPGRELDELVIRHIMNIPIVESVDLFSREPFPAAWWVEDEGWYIADERDEDGLIYRPFNPSENAAAALEVAEQLQKQGYVVCIELLPYEKTSVGVYEADPANQIAYAKAQTPAEAICKAALLAVMGLD